MEIKRKRRCKCGCRGIVRTGNIFINGHNSRTSERTAEWNKNISDSMKGVIFSEEHRAKLSLATSNYNSLYRSGENHPLYNKRRGRKTRMKCSIANSGSNNWNWQGGKSYEVYCCSWKDSEYKEYIKERDSYGCQNPLCEGYSKKLNIHHIDYNKKNCRPGNLITLCVSCNSRANFNREFWQKHYEEIMKRRK